MSLEQIAIAADQLANTLIAGGWSDETLSARAHRLERRGSKRWARGRRVIDALFFWQPNHCESAYQSEGRRKQLPREYRL
jgi:hypothetical protein